MARTYTLADLATTDTTDAGWALATTRFLLRDIPNEEDAWPLGSLQDEEIQASLARHAFTDSADVVFFRPHATAASLLQSNPVWTQRWSVAGASEEYRRMSSIVAGIRAEGRSIDAAINTATSGEFDSRRARVMF